MRLFVISIAFLLSSAFGGPVIIDPFTTFPSGGIAPPSPDHYYEMEGVATATDNGTDTAINLTEQGTITEPTGKNGDARENSGSTSNYLWAVDNVDWEMQNDVSFSAWFYADSLADREIFGKGTDFSDSARGWRIRLNTDRVYFELASSSSSGWDKSVDTGASSVSTGAWYHIAWGRANNEIWIALNGGTKTTVAATTINDTTGAFNAFRMQSGSAHDGKIDEVAIWNSHELTDAEIDGLQSVFWNGSNW